MRVESKQAYNDAILPYLAPYLMPDRDMTTEQMVMNLRSALLQTPQFIRILFSFGTCFQCDGLGHLVETRTIDGKERDIEKLCPTCRGVDSEDQLHGFIIAYAPENQSYVYIAQCWVHAKASEEQLSELYFKRIRAWAESMGKRFLRMETQRDPRGFVRKWHFRAVSTMMELNLNESEVSNGQVQRAEEYIDPDSVSATLVESIGELPLTGDDPGEQAGGYVKQSAWSGSDTVHGSDRTESPAAVPTSDGAVGSVESVVGVERHSTGSADSGGNGTVVTEVA